MSLPETTTYRNFEVGSYFKIKDGKYIWLTQLSKCANWITKILCFDMRSFWIIWISLFLSKRGAFNIRISCLLLKPSARFFFFVVDTLIVVWPCIYISMLEEEDLCFASFGSTVLNVLSHKRTQNNLSKIQKKDSWKIIHVEKLCWFSIFKLYEFNVPFLFSLKLSIWSTLNKEKDAI